MDTSVVGTGGTEHLAADVARNIEQWERHLNPTLLAWERYAVHGRAGAEPQAPVRPALPLPLAVSAMWFAFWMAPLAALAALANGAARARER